MFVFDSTLHGVILQTFSVDIGDNDTYVDVWSLGGLWLYLWSKQTECKQPCPNANNNTGLN